MSFSATAFMCVLNEADILSWTIRHLVEQDVKVYVIDNWSVDGSGEIAREFPLTGYEKFPSAGPSRYFSLRPLLRRVAELAYLSGSDWCLHHDADEVRRSPRAGESLLDGLARVDKEGWTAVNFQVYCFVPTDEGYVGDPEGYFKYYTLDHGDCKMRQVKAWKRTGERVDLASAAGHYPAFSGIAVSPERFVLKHYPLRTSEQAARKVLAERVGRYDPVELSQRWHVQYAELAQTRRWLRRPDELLCYPSVRLPEAATC